MFESIEEFVVQSFHGNFRSINSYKLYFNKNENINTSEYNSI